jgi:hypothetical protein
MSGHNTPRSHGSRAGGVGGVEIGLGGAPQQMHRDAENRSREQRTGGDFRRQGSAGGAVQEVEEDGEAECGRGPAEMGGIAFRRPVAPRDQAARAFARREQRDGDPAAGRGHRHGGGEPEAEPGDRGRHQHGVPQHQHRGGDQGGRSHGLRAQDDQRTQRLVEAPWRRPGGDAARPMQREPRSGRDHDEGEQRREDSARFGIVADAGRPRLQQAAEAAHLRRHRARGIAPEPGIEQVGAVSEQAIGKYLATAGRDAVGQLVGAFRQEPGLLERPVDLALFGVEPAAFRREGGVLGASCGRGGAELRESVGDQLEAGLERGRSVVDLIAQGRQALLERGEPVFAPGIFIEAVRNVVEFRLERIEVRDRRGGGRRGSRGCGRLRLLRDGTAAGQRQRRRKQRGAAPLQGVAAETAKHVRA